MSDPPQAIQPRQTAYIVQIKDILEGKLIKEEGWIPNHIEIGGKQVSRVNIIGTIIDSSLKNNVQTLIFDDGSGKITVRNFDKPFDVKIGDVVLLIGRIRQYGQEIYLSPEIIKKNINTKWNILWKKRMLQHMETDNKEIDETKKEVVKDEPQSQREKILNKIRDLDDGSGASYEEILNEFHDEKYIGTLLLEGDVFEIKPGRLKVLD